MNINARYIDASGSIYTDDVANDIEVALKAEGYIARADTGRVYVSRKLSKGLQRMGYIEINDSDIDWSGLDRNRAGIRDLVLRALA